MIQKFKKYATHKIKRQRTETNKQSQQQKAKDMLVKGCVIPVTDGGLAFFFFFQYI